MAMCSDTPTAPYSWKTFFSCCDLLSFFSGPVAPLPGSAVLLGSCRQTEGGGGGEVGSCYWLLPSSDLSTPAYLLGCHFPPRPLSQARSAEQ